MEIRPLLPLTIAASSFSELKCVTWLNGLEDQLDLLTRLPPRLPISEKKGAECYIRRSEQEKIFNGKWKVLFGVVDE